jgi:hypothetical protein
MVVKSAIGGNWIDSTMNLPFTGWPLTNAILPSVKTPDLIS